MDIKKAELVFASKSARNWNRASRLSQFHCDRFPPRLGASHADARHATLRPVTTVDQNRLDEVVITAASELHREDLWPYGLHKRKTHSVVEGSSDHEQGLIPRRHGQDQAAKGRRIS